MARHQACGKVRITQGRRADDDPGGTAGQGSRDGRRIPQAPGHLAAQAIPHRGDDLVDDPRLDWPAAECAVQIDHVEPGRARVGEGPGHRHGIVAIDGFLPGIALAQADHASRPQVDGRQELERRGVDDPVRIVVVCHHVSMLLHRGLAHGIPTGLANGRR